MYRNFLFVGLASCHVMQIPYDADNAQRTGIIIGNYNSIPDVVGPVPIRLTFDDAADITMQSADGFGFNTEVSGSVSLLSDTGEDVHVELEVITITGEGDGPFESSELGIGPGSELLENFHQVDIIPTSDQGGVLRLGHEESLSCTTNSSITVPWIFGEYISYILGEMHLINSDFTEVITSSEGSNAPRRFTNRLRLFNGDLEVPYTLFMYIRSIIPNISHDSVFENCNEIRERLPIVVVQLEPAGSQIFFYPEDYTVAIPSTSSCLLRVRAAHDAVDGYISMNPFLLKDVGVSINTSTVTFCDVANH